MFIFPFVATAETFAMGLEALSVINLRMQLFSKGGEEASRKANLMVSEKMGVCSNVHRCRLWLHVFSGLR